MNVGDKVRLLHGKEEGILTRIIDQQLVEVAIDGDFRIQVLRREVSIVSPTEAMVFGSLKQEKSVASGHYTPEPSKKIMANKGVYLAFEPFNDRELLVHVINNTDFDVPMSLGYETKTKIYQGIFTGVIKQRSSIKMPEILLVKDFENWPSFVFQLLYHRNDIHDLQPPFLRRMRFAKAQNFFKTKQNAPIIGKQAHLFQVDGEDSVQPTVVTSSPPADFIKEKIVSNVGKQPLHTIFPAPSSVDLHIEKLFNDKEIRQMSPAVMLSHQLNAFDKFLDSAIANHLSEITVIHGVGAGTLRDEIQKRISNKIGTYVEFFKDADKQKFGYGATYIKLK